MNKKIIIGILNAMLLIVLIAAALMQTDIILIVLLAVLLVVGLVLMIKIFRSDELIEVDPREAVIQYRKLLHEDHKISLSKEASVMYKDTTANEHRFVFTQRDPKYKREIYFIFACDRYLNKNQEIVFRTPFGIKTDRFVDAHRFIYKNQDIPDQQLSQKSIMDAVKETIQAATKDNQQGGEQE